MTRIALFQSNTGIDPAVNAEALTGAIAEGAAGGATILFTPEMSGLLDRDSNRASASLREEDEDMALAASRAAAIAHGIWVHLGSLAVLVGDGKLANRSFVIDRLGKVRARYDKIHLFDVDLPTGESWRESAHWHTLLKARAIEAGLFVIAAAQVGRHEDGRQTFGHSLVVDPWGEVLLDMGEDVGVGFAEIDLARIPEVRSRIPALNHRRAIADAVSQ
jgi:predicted amidohydrolase